MTEESRTTDHELITRAWLAQMKTLLSWVENAMPAYSVTACFEDAIKDQQQRTDEALGMMHPFTAYFTHAQRGLESASAGLDPFGIFSSFPALGYTREKQLHMQELFTLWADCERHFSAFMTLAGQAGGEAMIAFQDYLHNPPETAAPLSSLRAVYEKWIDISDEVYAARALRPEYAETYGKAINALMMYRKKFNQVTDETAETLGLPTRREVDALHRRVHTLRQTGEEHDQSP